MASAAIQAQNQEAYQAGIIRLGKGQYMIRSKSNPTTGHVVTRGKDFAWSCDCKAATYRGKCRHISIARGYEVARECGYDGPNEPDMETLDYYIRIENVKYERALRGIPIEAP